MHRLELKQGTIRDKANADVSVPPLSGPLANLAGGDVITVTTNLDIVDGMDGVISLREAINSAADGDTITFDAALTGMSIVLTNGEIVIADDITIDGDIDSDGTGDITLNGNAAGRVLNFNGATATLESLIITNGAVTGAIQGAAIQIQPNANVTIDNSIITANMAEFGAGIQVDGTLTLTNSVVSNNIASNQGGGIIVSDAGFADISLVVCTVSVHTYCSTRFPSFGSPLRLGCFHE